MCGSLSYRTARGTQKNKQKQNKLAFINFFKVNISLALASSSGCHQLPLCYAPLSLLPSGHILWPAFPSHHPQQWSFGGAESNFPSFSLESESGFFHFRLASQQGGGPAVRPQILYLSLDRSRRTDLVIYSCLKLHKWTTAPGVSRVHHTDNPEALRLLKSHPGTMNSPRRKPKHQVATTQL